MRLISLKKFNEYLSCVLLAAALSVTCMNADADNKTGAALRDLPFPRTWARYKTEIFRLVNPSYSVDPQTKKSHYDPQFAGQFDKVINKFSGLDKALKKKLLSGPASQGKYIAIGEDQYIFYTICQAHWCNVTNIAVLYQPDKQRMIGRLLYNCDVYKLGGVSEGEMWGISHLAPFTADADDCTLAKEQK